MIRAPRGDLRDEQFVLADRSANGPASAILSKSHGRPRVDDRRALIGIIFIHRNGLRWSNAPREYGPPKTLYNRWEWWSGMGVFVRIMEGLLRGGRTEGRHDRRDISESAPHGLEPAGQKEG